MWPRWRQLPGERAPGRDQAAARKKVAARRLFVLGLTRPALRLLPMRSVRATRIVRATGIVRVSVSVLVCVCAGLVRLLLGSAPEGSLSPGAQRSNLGERPWLGSPGRTVGTLRRPVAFLRCTQCAFLW